MVNFIWRIFCHNQNIVKNQFHQALSPRPLSSRGPGCPWSDAHPWVISCGQREVCCSITCFNTDTNSSGAACLKKRGGRKGIGQQLLLGDLSPSVSGDCCEDLSESRYFHLPNILRLHLLLSIPTLSALRQMLPLSLSWTSTTVSSLVPPPVGPPSIP